MNTVATSQSRDNAAGQSGNPALEAAPDGFIDRPLDAASMLADIVADGLILAGTAPEIALKLAAHADHRHPILRIAEANLNDERQPGRKLTAEVLTQWLAARHGLPYLRIDPLNMDVNRITTAVPYAYAARAKILPVKLSPGELTIATSEPGMRSWERDLGRASKLIIRRIIANPAEIERYQIEFYALARSVKASESERSKLAGFGSASSLEQLMQLGRAGKLDANDQHIVNIVDWLLQYAFESRASDIHLEPRRDAGNVRFRIDGVLHEVYRIPGPVMAAVTSRIKILGRMDVAEKRKPQDGRIKTRSPQGREIELRVASLPTAFGEKLVLRIFDPEVLVKDFAQLGFGSEEARKWRAMIEQPHGIVLVTGPTGSGKTTTLYSSLKQLATPKVNVCTIEDPIELVDGSFNQMQVQGNIELGFAEGIRALMRQDPDIIMVGEIRDLATAEVAVQAALTGHLVLSTLHTNDAPSAVSRLLDLGVPAYLIKATLLGVVAQRLIRKLCPHCSRPIEINAGRWRELTIGSQLPLPAAVREPVGCLECRQTGYLGRVGIYEMMPMSAGVKSLINDETDLTRLRDAALKEGMTPLRIAGCVKVAEGLTSVEEILGVAPIIFGEH